MNALFIGPYRQNDGWGIASRAYIKAIATQIPNLATRPIFFVNNTMEPDNDILSYENTTYQNYDIIFQKTLPHCISATKKVKKNVGLFVLETNDISKSTCITNLNSIDEICVPSKQEAVCLKKSGVKTPIKIISQPLDTDFIKNNYNHQISSLQFNKHTFKFYTIGEYVERKNFKDLIIAFHLAFHNTDNVELVLKTHRPGLSPQQSTAFIKKEITNIKRKMNIKQSYKKEILITERLTDLDMIGLHNACDCFILPSKGEAFCRPAAEAMVLGKTPIVTDHTGMTDFVNNNNGYVIHSHKHPVIVNERTLSNDFDIYTANEHWYQPNIYSIVESMQKAYALYKTDKKALKIKQELGMSMIDTFSYTSIGHKICASV